MKTTEAVPRLGVIDALSTGIHEAIRRPQLILVPVLIDFLLWLAPRVSVAPLLQTFLRLWESLVQSTYTAAQLASLSDMLNALREAVGQASAQVNLLEGIAAGWSGVPSTVALGQVTRMTFISDLVLAPAGLIMQMPQMVASPLQGAALDVSGVGAFLLWGLLFWLVGQLFVALYLRWAGRPWMISDAWDGPRGFVRLAVQLTTFSILIGMLIFLLRIPLAFALTLLLVASGSVLGIVSLVVGGLALWLTLWFLMALYLVSEVIVLDGQSVWRAVVRSAGLVHRNFASVLTLAALINLLSFGFRVVWEWMGQSLVGAPIAIIGNGFLVTAMLLSVYVFFDNLRKQAVPQRSARTVDRA